ncbi:MAG: PAS domain-containing protein, partial [Victivallales bacterium]|nr:PAS domain-containing protein [Victivallales bacterium]
MKLGLRIVLLLCIAGMLPCRAVDSSSSAAPKRVLWINTYSSDDPWCSSLTIGFHEVMRHAKLKIKEEVFDLGIRYQLNGEVSAKQLNALQNLLKVHRYDVIVTTDTGAAELFLDGRLNLPENTPVVLAAYAGIKPLEDRILPASPITGVQLGKNLEESIRLARRLLPNLKKVTLVIESVYGGKRISVLDSKIQNELKVHINLISGDQYSTEEMLDLVSALPSDSLLLFQSWMSAKDSHAEHSYTVLPRIRENFSGLIFGKYDSYLAFGAMGGAIEQGHQIGRLVGEQAHRLLTGIPIGKIPVVNSRPVKILDESALRELDIPRLRIPQQTIMVNVPESFWTKYAVVFGVAGIILIGVLLFYIAVTHIRRQVQWKNSVLFDHLASRVLVFNRNGNLLYSHMPMHEYEAAKSLKELPDDVFKLYSETLEQMFVVDEQEKELTYWFRGQYRQAVFHRLSPDNPFGQDVVMVTSTDMTALHNANLKAARLSNRLQLTLDSIGDGVIAIDQKGRITSLNPVAAELTGYTIREAIGKPLSEVFHLVSTLDGTPNDSPLIKAITDGEIEPLVNHTDLIAKDGTRRHIAESAAPIKEDGVIAGGVLVFRDVTEEYEKRTRLRVQTSAFYTAMKMAKFNSLRLSPQGKLISSSTEEEVWPCDENGALRPPQEWIDPEFVKPFLEQYQALLEGKSDHFYSIYSTSYKEEKKYFEARFEKSFNDITGEMEICGVIQDITEARRNEMLYRDNLNLFQTVVKHLPGFLFVKDIEDEFRFLLCNSKFEELMGYPSEALIGHRDRDFFVDENGLCKIEEDDNKLVADGGPLDIYESFTNPDGRFFAMRMVKKLVNRSDGKRLLVGMGVDLTREYLLERDQKETIKKLNDYIGSERVLYQMLSAISLADNFDEAINTMLRLVGENFDSDRSYVFRYLNDDCTRCTITHEWVSEQGTSLTDELHNIDMTAYAEFSRRILEHEVLALDDVSTLQEDLYDEFTTLRNAGVKSTITNGIWINGKPYGFIGVDFNRQKREFTECDTHTILGVSNLFQMAYDREKQRVLLESSVSMQRQIFNNIMLPLTIIDKDYRILAANPSMAAKSGFSMDELIGKKCYETICRADAPPEFCPAQETWKSGKSCQHEHDFNNRRQISHAQPIYDKDGKLIYVLTVYIDVTDMVRQRRELEVALEQAQSAERAKSYFLATVSHELRTPLNAIIGFSELMQHGHIEEKTQEEYLRSISFAGSSLLNLINDVLDLSKLEAEQMNIVPAESNVSAMIKEVADVFKVKAMEKGVELRVDVSNLRHILLVDALRLRQVLLNLMGNACKFTMAGHVALYAEFVPSKSKKTGRLTIRV